MRELAAKVKNEVPALLTENEPLRQKREEKERKRREEDKAKRDRLEQSLRRVSLSCFAWIFPCIRESAEKIVNRFLWKVSDNVDDPIVSSLHMVNKQLGIAEQLRWEDNTSDLKPLITECVNLLNGNSEEKRRIVIVMYDRKEKILILSDGDLRKKFADLLSVETNEKFVEMVLKFNAALGRLVEERLLEKAELLSKEALLPKLVIGYLYQLHTPKR